LHIITAVKYLKALPLISVIVLFKEIFGFLLIVVPGVKALIERPVPRTCTFTLYPIPETSGLAILNPVAFVIACLSNLRSAITQGILCRWGIDIPHIGQENDMLKIGNLFVLAIRFVLQTKEKPDLLLTIGFFSDAFQALFWLCVGFFFHYIIVSRITNFLLDIEDGKIGDQERRLGLEGIYRAVNGEPPTNEFIKGVVLRTQRPEKAKAD
jgi:hypothetical protein